MAYTLIEHQEEDGKENEKNIMKDVMISDFLVYYWMCTTIKNIELLKGWRTVIKYKQFQNTKGPLKFNKLLY